MDRQSVAADTIFGEDALNKFNTQHPIEMYVEDGEGYAGDKEIMTQFGLENRNEITFVVHKKRFQERWTDKFRLKMQQIQHQVVLYF